MRCPKCTALRISDLYNNSVCLHDTLDALMASAEKGCDFCILCRTRCEQVLSPIAQPKPGNDTSVWLEGELHPGQEQKFLTKRDYVAITNNIMVYIGSPLNERVRMHIGELSVFAEPGTPASLLFCNDTWTTVDRNPRGYLDFASRSITHCQRLHQKCTPFSSNSKAASEMPTRLIDLGDPRDQKSARLVTPRASNIQAEYVALSYCWGEDVQSSTMLRESNLEELQLRIDEEKLPKTYRDVFQLARELEFRYIWIDALCIIQGHHQDWERESQRMSHVYGNAALTVAAGRAATCEDGFLENRLRPAAGPCAIPFYYEKFKGRAGVMDEKGEMGQIWVSLPRSREDGPVGERGWCLQESLLSFRMLVFAKEQIRFQCREMCIWENGYASRTPYYELYRDHDLMSSSLRPNPHPLGLASKGRSAQEQADERLRRQALDFWYKEILWKYTTRKLSDTGDIFAAISGLAQMVKTLIRSRYLGGLWEVDIVRGLLWRPRPLLTRDPRRRPRWQRRMTKRDPDMQTQAVPLKVPSWSWAAVQGGVGIDQDRDETVYDESNALIRPKYEGRWTRDPICHANAVEITSCELELYGRPRLVQVQQVLPKGGNVPKVSEFTRAPWMVLMPLREDEEEDMSKKDRDTKKPNHIVAQGRFDIRAEIVSMCWCMPLTKREGLMLNRDEDGNYHRAGIMKIVDLAWMMSVQEEDIRLI
ncbi:heterokaryon incompatibility protein-domain-containing protein [Xylaria nigripes]|nr:heterokaryon incompatibility protein-domain-containing protein [Xylaria nigripes]